MSKAPAIYRSTHRIRFSDLDPYKHMRTAMYSAYYMDHRLDAVREQAGWDIKTLEELPFMVFTRRLDIEFLRPVIGDQEISIASFVREFVDSDAHVECCMSDASGNEVSKCHFLITYVDRASRKPAPWPAHVKDHFFIDQVAPGASG